MSIVRITEDQPAPAKGIDRFVLPIEPFGPETPCASVYTRFVDDAELLAVPICDDGRPVGLVDRYDFLRNLAHSYGRALFDRKPIVNLMDRDPLVVERTIGIAELQSTISTDRPNALIRGFIVTDGGRYCGMGTALGLLRASLFESEATNARLSDALKESEAAVRLKSRFFANLSHEFRTPLNAIIGFSELMTKEIRGKMNEHYLDYATDILASGNHMLSLVNDLLDLAKIETGEMHPHFEKFDIGETIHSAARFVDKSAAKAKLAVTINVANDLPWVEADPRHVRQILLNLLSNAIKFTPVGTVTVFAARHAGKVEIGVSDTGIGMSPAEIEIALKPFGQVANHLTRNHEGTGLGLPLVKALAELNRSRLEIRSEPSAGTRISMCLEPAALD